MACNCETQKQIDKLYHSYRDKSQLPDNPKFTDYLKYYTGNVFVYGLMFIAFPLLVLYILILLFWRENERIHVSDVDLIRKFSFLKD